MHNLQLPNFSLIYFQVFFSFEKVIVKLKVQTQLLEWQSKEFGEILSNENKVTRLDKI